MCLHLEESFDLKLATEDIICYKMVEFGPAIIMSPDKLHGKKFYGIIRGIEADGIISVEDNDIYFCTNDDELDCHLCRNTFGYIGAYRRDLHITSLIVDGIELITQAYITPFRYFPIEIGETYHSELIRDGDLIYVGLHSFAYSSNITKCKTSSAMIVKCIIPKGSDYYEGEFWGFNSYASDCIKYLEFIEE